MRRAGYAVAAGACAAGAARLAYSAMSRRPPGGPKAWSRTNHRGEPVTLLEGPAVAAGALAGVLAQAGLAQAGLAPASGSPGASGSAGWRRAAAMVLGGAGAAAFGAYDDLAGSGDRRGFRGHLGALRQGEVTTGAVKLGGIGVTGVVSAALAGGSPADVILNAGLVAGGANLLNLFDLRPGRAIKVAAASGALLGAAGQDSVAAPLGAALALLPEDLGERAMLGDAGANALGAMLGASAAGLSRPARIALLAGIAGLTAASEKVSFTKVIARTPALNWLDMLGRRPAPQTSRPGQSRRDSAALAAAPGHDPGPAARIGRVSTPVAERGSARPRGGGIGRAAVLIGAITMLARVIGFGRQVVFAHTVQASCLGTAYTTANMVPNIIYDIVAGGALTAVVVPVLAGPARSDPEQVRRTSAALLTWAVLLLVPVSLVVAVIARAAGVGAARRDARLPAGRHGDARRADAGGVRAADPALRPGRGALRHPAGAPQVRRARAGAGAVQPGRHRRVLLVRRGRERLPGPDPAGARPGLDRAGGRHHRRGGGAGRDPAHPGRPAAPAAAAPAAFPPGDRRRGSARWPRPASRR